MVAVTVAAATTIHAEVDTGTHEYDGVLPTVSGDSFTETTIPTWVTNPEKFQGKICLKNVAVTDFTSNPYGNESSVVRLEGVSGWLRAPGNYPFTNSVPIEIAGTLTIDNGSSANDGNPNRCTVFKKVSGNGYIYTTATADHVVVVIQDATEFTGGLALSSGKYIVFGQAMPDYTTVLSQTTVGTIFVMSGAKVTNSNFWWATGGIKVDGELCAPFLNHSTETLGFGGGTYITTSDTGTFTLTSTGNGVETETGTDYARISGTGTLKYEGTGWRAISTNNFPTAMTVENEQAGDLLLSRALTYTIGSLSGTKNIQGNYGSDDRYLRVLQSKDTEWSGNIIYDYYDRFKGLIVAPGVSAAGTLTLSGTQPQSRALTVEAGAKVNITGTWVGPTTVAGTLSGTGTVSGDVTLSDGATLKVASVDSPLNTTGSFTATGNIKILLPADADVAQRKTLVIANSSFDVDGATFDVVIEGEAPNTRSYDVKVSGNRLTVKKSSYYMTFR